MDLGWVGMTQVRRLGLQDGLEGGHQVGRQGVLQGALQGVIWTQEESSMIQVRVASIYHLKKHNSQLTAQSSKLESQPKVN